MFGRKGKKESPIESFIGLDTTFQGSINSKGLLRVDGNWEGGNVSAQGIIVGETGTLKGDINAKSVIIGGKVTGNVTASEILEIHSKARVKGDIKTSHLLIAEGAFFEGNCSMIHEEGLVSEEKTQTAKGAKLETPQVFLPEK